MVAGTGSRTATEVIATTRPTAARTWSGTAASHHTMGRQPVTEPGLVEARLVGSLMIPWSSRTVEQAPCLPGVTGAATTWTRAGPARHQATPPRGVARRPRRGSRKPPKPRQTNSAKVH